MSSNPKKRGRKQGYVRPDLANPQLIAEIKVLLHSGVPKYKIAKEIGIHGTTLNRIIDRHGLSPDIDLDAPPPPPIQGNYIPAHMPASRVLDTPLVRQQIVAETLSQRAERERERQLEVTEEVERLAWEAINVMGRTSAEIASFQDEDSLLKKTQLLKNATDLIKTTHYNRRRLLRVEDEAKSETAADMFDIDFVAAAKAGGVEFDEDPMKGDRDD